MLLVVEQQADHFRQYLVKQGNLADLFEQMNLYNESIVIRPVPDFLRAFLIHDWPENIWNEVLVDSGNVPG